MTQEDCARILAQAQGAPPQGAMARKPVIDGDAWRICEMPNLGELAGASPARQHIVDHGFLHRPDGKWQMWACLRGTAIGRLIYGWEGDSLEQGPWAEQGVTLRAGVAQGEIVDPQEKVGAPFFLQHEDLYYCFYHSRGVHALTSRDGVEWKRYNGGEGSSLLLKDAGRDVMILRAGDTFFLYLTVTCVSKEGWPRCFVILRTSKDLQKWSDFTIVSEGGVAGNGPVNAESPFVVALDGYYYLFRATSIDPATYVYRSATPYHFGVHDDSKLIAVLPIKAPEVVLHEGQYYISDLADFQGITLAKLRWELE